jgi:hypothetical protein
MIGEKSINKVPQSVPAPSWIDNDARKIKRKERRKKREDENTFRVSRKVLL